MNINFKPSGEPQGPLTKIIAFVVGVLTLAAAFMFSLVFVVVLAVAGLAVWLWFWWQTRALRRQMREQRQAQMDAMAAMNEAGYAAGPADVAPGAAIIEGEAVRVVDEKDPRDRLSN